MINLPEVCPGCKPAYWQEPEQNLSPNGSHIAWLETEQTNMQKRRKFAQGMIGKTVHVYKLGGVRPEDDPNTAMYLPLPEYGICLITFRDARQGPFDNPWPDLVDAVVRDHKPDPVALARAENENH